MGWKMLNQEEMIFWVIRGRGILQERLKISWEGNMKVEDVLKRKFLLLLKRGPDWVRQKPQVVPMRSIDGPQVQSIVYVDTQKNIEKLLGIQERHPWFVDRPTDNRWSHRQLLNLFLQVFPFRPCTHNNHQDFHFTFSGQILGLKPNLYLVNTYNKIKRIFKQLLK